MTISHESSIPGVSTARRERDRAQRHGLAIPRPLWGWLALLGAPVAWAVHIGARYPLVAVACDAATIAPLVAVTLGCLALGALSLATSIWLVRRCAGARRDRAPLTDEEELAPRAPDERALSRLDFLGRAGVLTSLVFLAVIVAEGITPFFYDPCVEYVLP